MFEKHHFLNAFYTIILIFIAFPSQSFAQVHKFINTSFRDGWRIEFKTGAGALLTPVPDIYVERINNVNIPLHIPGPIGVISIKKNITAHIEMGYQFDYMRTQGTVKVLNSDIEVLTQAYNNSYLIQYNLKKTNEFEPLLNYFLYYKIGAISLKNDPLDKLPEGTINVTSDSKGKFINNVAVLTGFGAGINYQLNNNLSLTSSLDINRSSDALEDIYQIQKLFFQSSHTVNTYGTISFGFCYWFNFTKQKKSTFYKSKTETEKRLIQSRTIKRKSKSSVAKHSLWYDNK
jgi:hypothetical protein